MKCPKPVNKYGCFTCLLVLSQIWANVGKAEHSVGGPGDPLRLLVSEARDDATVIVIRVKPEDIDASPKIKEWYTANYESYLDSLHTATLEWIEPEAATCAYAYTETHRIVFSYPTCKRALPPDSGAPANQRITNKAAAVKLLLHENVHLLGILDETFADQVALAIYRTWLALDINRTPRWDDLSPDNRPSERTAHASALIQTTQFTGLFVWGGCNETPPTGQSPSGVACSTFLGDGGIYDRKADVWTPVPPVPKTLLKDPLEGLRAYATAVHIPAETSDKLGDIYIFGGCSGAKFTCEKDYNSILVFNLDTKSWSVVSVAFAPPARSKHYAFWTGSSMLIWGGIADPMAPGRGNSLNDGWLFNAKSRNWSSISAQNAPSPRRYSAVVFTGNHNQNQNLDQKLIVYGGCDREIGEQCPTYYKDGGIYDLIKNEWRALPSVSLTARAKASPVWTGNEMVVLGGWSGSRALSDGAILKFSDSDTSEMSWTIIGDLNSEPRYGHTAAWVGDRIVLWGGLSGYNKYVSGLSEYYLPTTNAPRGTWRRVELTAAPVSRTENTSFWLQDGLLVWGGISEDRSYLQTGGIFHPKVVRW